METLYDLSVAAALCMFERSDAMPHGDVMILVM